MRTRDSMRCTLRACYYKNTEEQNGFTIFGGRAIRILMLNGPLPMGTIHRGVTKWIHELNRHLNYLGHEAHVMGYGNFSSPISFVSDEIHYHAIPRIYFDNFLLGKCLSNHIVKLNKRYRFDLINGHTGHYTYPAILARGSLNVPVITTIHAIDLDEFLSCHKEMKLIYGLKYFGPRRLGGTIIGISSIFAREYFAHKFSDMLISVSYYSLRKKTCVVQGGVAKESREKELAVGNSAKKKLLFVGGIEPRKGLHYLIRALSLTNEDVEVTIAGAGYLGRRYEAYLKNMIAKLNVQKQVKFLGIVDEKEKWKLYRSSDIFVLPSIHEALGLVILEAMSVGLPVIASNVGGIPEIVKDGFNGLLFEPRNSRDLAEKIGTLLNDSGMRERIGRNARRSVPGKTWGNMAREYTKIYESCTS